MTVNFLGLTGPQGVLPLDYSLYAASRVRAGDRALKDFLGPVRPSHHLAVLSRVGEVARGSSFSIAACVGASEASAAPDSSSPRDALTAELLAVLGMDTPGLTGRLPIPDESLLYYAGLLSMPSRPAAALEQLVSDYFDVPCEVEQFVGAWYPLDTSAQTALGDEGRADSGAAPSPATRCGISRAGCGSASARSPAAGTTSFFPAARRTTRSGR